MPPTSAYAPATHTGANDGPAHFILHENVVIAGPLPVRAGLREQTARADGSESQSGPAWLYRKSEDRWRRLVLASATGPRETLVDMPLAIDDRTGFTRRKERVRPGDRVLLVTDGVLEAPAPDELLGVARLERVLHQHRHEDERRLAEGIREALTAHMKEPELSHDDVTLLLLEFVPGPPAFGIWHGLKRRLFRRPQWVQPLGP